MNRDDLIERMARAAIIDLPHADVCLHVMCSALPGLAAPIAARVHAAGDAGKAP